MSPPEIAWSSGRPTSLLCRPRWTPRADGRSARHSSLAALIAVESAIFAIGAALVLISTHHSVEQRREGLLLATAAGALFGVSDVAVKYLTHAHGPLLGLISPWTLTAVISFVISFYASARSLQVGLPIEVIAITSVTANLAAIVGGILIFGESIGSGALGTTARVLAFCLVIAGAALIPAPLRLKPTETHTADEATSEGSCSVTVRDACASAPGHDEFVGSALSSPRQIAEPQNEEAPKR
jgi:hypothetical protein